jgi:hypothetical protein
MKAVLFKKCQEGSDLLCETSRRKQSHWTTKVEAERLGKKIIKPKYEDKF